MTALTQLFNRRSLAMRSSFVALALFLVTCPCDDGSHGCELESDGGICYRTTEHNWACDCAEGTWCSSGCSAPYSAHECVSVRAN